MGDANGPAGHQVGAWRFALRNFGSAWFLIPQGTGILAVILHNLDYQFKGLAIISQIFWVFTIVTLVGCLAIYLLRAIVWPRYVAHQLRHNSVEASGLASISIAFTTVIIMIALNLVTTWNRGWGIVAYALWWINAGIAAVACIGIPYVNAYFNSPGIESLSPVTLLPPIAALTMAAGGGVISMYSGLDAGHTLPVVVVSYLFIGIGLFYSLLIDAAVLTRLMVHASWPPKEMVYQLMILCGPPGQGSFALQSLGSAIKKRHIFAQYASSLFVSPSVGAIVAPVSEFLGLLIWGYGTFWWGFACIATLHYLFTSPKEVLDRRKVLTAWSLVFPWGVYTNAAVQLGVVLNSSAFRVWSTVLTILLVIIWLSNATMTILGVIAGALVGVDRGWRAHYTTSGAENEKDREKQADEVGSGEAGQTNHAHSESSNGLRQRYDAVSAGSVQNGTARIEC